MKKRRLKMLICSSCSFDLCPSLSKFYMFCTLMVLSGLRPSVSEARLQEDCSSPLKLMRTFHEVLVANRYTVSMQVYRFNVPTFGKDVVFDVPHKVRAEQFKMFSEALKVSKMTDYVPLFEKEAKVSSPFLAMMFPKGSLFDPCTHYYWTRLRRFSSFCFLFVVFLPLICPVFNYAL